MNATRRCLFVPIVMGTLLVAAAAGSDHAPRPTTDLIDRLDLKVPPATELAGVGIALARRQGQLFVGRVFEGTPAAASGKVRVGDRLVSVGEQGQAPVAVSGMSIQKVVPMIRGPKGTLVVLTMIPAGKTEADAIAVPLTRGPIKELNRFGDGRLIPPGMKAPDFEAVLLPGGGRYELGASDGKIVVLEFWASCCAPCIKLLDHLGELEHAHPEWKGRVQMVAIGIDEDKEKAAACAKSHGTQWHDVTVVWGGPSIAKRFHVAGFPAMYLLDRGGRVIAQNPETDVATIIQKALAAGGNDQPPK